MSSIHGLQAVIEQLELRLAEFQTANPTAKQKYAIDRQVEIIQQLQGVYSQYEKFILWDVFIEIQREADAITAKDAEINGLVVRIKFKDNCDIRKFGFIDFTI